MNEPTPLSIPRDDLKSLLANTPLECTDLQINQIGQPEYQVPLIEVSFRPERWPLPGDQAHHRLDTTYIVPVMLSFCGTLTLMDEREVERAAQKAIHRFAAACMCDNCRRYLGDVAAVD